jgi:hypothetical protein
MKVVCENLGENLGYETCIDDITVGKSYDVISQHVDYIIRGSTITDYVTLYNLKNDKGNMIRYNKKLFLNLEDWRELRINEILTK